MSLIIEALEEAAMFHDARSRVIDTQAWFLAGIAREIQSPLESTPPPSRTCRFTRMRVSPDYPPISRSKTHVSPDYRRFC